MENKKATITVRTLNKMGDIIGEALDKIRDLEEKENVFLLLSITTRQDSIDKAKEKGIHAMSWDYEKA